MIFEVTDEQIERLSDSDLRTLVGHLCEQELRGQGHSPAAVTAGGNQNAKDGGIDVRVDLPQTAIVSGYVPAAATGFQVKAQDMPRARILEEMAPDGVVRPSIEDLAKRNGAYVIVSSQGSLADTALADRKEAMREAVGPELAATLTVHFYDRHYLARWVHQHPALIPWVHEKVGQPLAGWRPFGDWSSSPTDVDKPYFLDDHVRLLSPSMDNPNGVSVADGVNSLRKLLAEPQGVVRLVGLSGVGKTRLVQALFDARIGADALNARDAIYTDMSNSPNPVPLELASRLVSLRQRAILIIDNCGPDLHQRLTTKVTEAASQVSLITVEHDINDDEPEKTNVFKLEVASVELIERILEARFPNIAQPSRRAIAEFSDGNARIAFALAATAKSGDSLATLRDTDLFKRLFEQAKGPNEALLNAAKVCALVYSFDGETFEGDEAELPILAGLLGVSTDQLYASVSELIRRKLVQTRGKWRAILPHAIAHRLAKIALEDIPMSKIEEAIVHGKNTRMLKSFSRRLGYMHHVPVVRDLVSRWLSEGGFLDTLGNLNALGEAILFNVAPVDPALTLKYIERAVASREGFYTEKNLNRNLVIRLLRSLAYDAPLFDRCVKLLREFASHSEPGNNSDSAGNVLKSLFFIYLSGTHATVAQRLAFVRSLLDSSDANSQELGVSLLRTMLECAHFSSSYAFEFGARSRDFGANPRGPEITAWFQQVLDVCRTYGLSNKPLAAAIRKLVASRFGDIAFRAGLIDELIALAGEFAAGSGWPEGWIGIRGAIRRWKKGGKVPEEEIRRLETLASALQPTDLPELVRSYALSKEWTSLDIAEIEEDEKDDPGAARTRVFEFCIDLGKKLVKQPETLHGLLPEIFASGSQKTGALGRGIAAECSSPKRTWAYLSDEFLKSAEATRNGNILAGFVEETKRRAPLECDEILDGALADPNLHPQLIYLQAYAGVDGSSLKRLLAALDAVTVPTGTFQILETGRLHEGLNDAQLAEFLRKLCTRPDGLPVAAEILGMRIHGAKSDKLPVSEAVKEMGRELLSQLRFETKGPHHEYVVARIVEVSVDRPEDYTLACVLCNRIVEALATYKINNFDIDDVMKSLCKACPRAVLDTVIEVLNANRLRPLFSDIRETRPDPLGEISDETLTAWASEKPDTRFPALAEAVRFSDGNEDSASKGWSSAAMKIIELAPDVAKILGTFMERFRPMSWTGSRAEIMASRIPLIQSLAGHARPEVAAWAATALPQFEALVARDREREAARDKQRDERFED